MRLTIYLYGNNLSQAKNFQKVLIYYLPSRLADQKVSFNIIFTSEKTIRELNKKYLGRNTPTDVLTFPLDQNIQIDNQKLDQIELGDVYICGKIALKNHHQVDRLIVHGFLHLIGLNHQSLQQSINWDKIEKAIFETI